MSLEKTDIAYGAWDPGSIFGPPSSHTKTPLERYDNFFPHSEEPEYQVIEDENENHEFHVKNERGDAIVETSDGFDEEDSLNEEENENISNHERDSISDQHESPDEGENENLLENEEDSIQQDCADEKDSPDEGENENPREKEEDSIKQRQSSQEFGGKASEPELDFITQDEDDPLDEEIKEPLSQGSPILEDSLDANPCGKMWGAYDESKSKSHETDGSPRVEEDGRDHDELFDLACCKIQKLARGYLVRKIPLQLPPIVEDEDQQISSPSPVEDMIVFHQVQKKPNVDKQSGRHSPYYFSLPDRNPENQEIDQEIEHLERLFVDASKEFDESSELEEDQEATDLDSVSECEMLEDSIEPLGRPEVSSQMRLLEILANDDSDWDQMIGSIPTPCPISLAKQNHLPTVHELRKLATDDGVFSARSKAEEDVTSSDPPANQQRIHPNKVNAALISR
jgi:hypothetical protein